MPANALKTRDTEACAEPQGVPPAPPTTAPLPLPVAVGELTLPIDSPFPPTAAPRRRRLSLTLLSFLVMVAAPTALAAIYYLLIATDQYVVEFRFGLRSAEPVRAEDTMLLPVTAAPLQTAADSYAIAQYIASRAIVDDLGRSLDLRRMFANPAADWPARLHLPVAIEELVTYWQRQVDAFFDPTNGTIAVRVRAFTPPDALRLAQAVLASSERLVNELSARARRDALRDSEADVAAAESRLDTALAHLRDYRDQQGLIDPRKAADANSALASRLRDELVHAGAGLATMRQFMAPGAPAIKLLQARIDSLKAQQSALESEATETARSRQQALSRLMGSYDELESQRHFAETAYQHALEALDRVRISAERQQIYVADFVPPRLPEKSLYPRRWRSLGLVFLAASILWAIGGLTVRSIREHL
jgi:capsular polysaccharide transport system permease protein